MVQLVSCTHTVIKSSYPCRASYVLIMLLLVLIYLILLVSFQSLGSRPSTTSEDRNITGNTRITTTLDSHVVFAGLTNGSESPGESGANHHILGVRSLLKVTSATSGSSAVWNNPGLRDGSQSPGERGENQHMVEPRGRFKVTLLTTKSSAKWNQYPSTKVKRRRSVTTNTVLVPLSRREKPKDVQVNNQHGAHNDSDVPKVNANNTVKVNNLSKTQSQINTNITETNSSDLDGRADDGGVPGNYSRNQINSTYGHHGNSTEDITANNFSNISDIVWNMTESWFNLDNRSLTKAWQDTTPPLHVLPPSPWTTSEKVVGAILGVVGVAGIIGLFVAVLWRRSSYHNHNSNILRLRDITKFIP